MDPNRLTQNTQSALHDAQTKALRYGHTEVDVEHLLLALLEQPEGLVPRLLTNAGADTQALHGAPEQQPGISGPLIWAGPVCVEPPPTAPAASEDGRGTAAGIEDPVVILGLAPGRIWG